MKQTFLDSLIGLPVSKAESNVKDAGLDNWTVEDGIATMSLALEKTVILREKDGIVVDAEAGDPCELE